MSKGKPSSRSARVMESRRIAQRERAALEREYRERLTQEVAIDGTFYQAMLIDAAVSCALDISIITRRFLQCCATSGELERCSKARAQLSRLLGQLNVAPKSESEPATGPSLESWLEDWRTKQKPQDGPIPPDSGRSEVQS